jgi:hypothetical protein
MKYIVGASIGGLFGIGAPLMFDASMTDSNINDTIVPRLEEFQHVNPMLPVPIDEKLILPDNICGYIDYDSIDTKEQVKECMQVSMPTVPAI